MVAAGLFVSWALHDLEEILGMRHWTHRVVPRLRARHPWVPEPVWAAVSNETGRMAVAVSLVGVPVALAAARGARTEGRSALFQAAVTAYGAHGVGHVAASVLARDYTPGALTSPVFVVPYALWAHHRLRRAGAWRPMSRREMLLSAASVPVLVGAAQVAARLLTRRR